ncbi:MAG TPA: hypothetical protein VH988_32635 [Thermoanaerobaculia bacterium]|nr:hypothetical protein [Thermoanaerobaculia bacterium]
MRRGNLYLAVVLALAVSSAAPARAAGSGGNGALSSWPSLHGLWAWLVAVVSHQPALQTHCDRRCTIVVAPTSDCGSHIDPDGHCNAV